MNLNADDFPSPSGCRARTFSNTSQQSHHSYKQVFPSMTSDSGLYTCSSNTSDCSLQLESDTDSHLGSHKVTEFKDERLQMALQDIRKLRSELERLTKSEQWYKQELRQQKSTRLDDLERIYSKERKFMMENQRLQKECVRLYEKCNALERELEVQNQESHEYHMSKVYNEEGCDENIFKFEKEQHVVVIKDQQQLISVLRKQKRSLLEDLRSLTEEKEEKVLELQRLLADLEYDNKLITKKCTQIVQEHSTLESNLKQSDNRHTIVQQEKLNLQKSIVDLKEQLEIQQQLVNLKENEIERLQQHYTNKIQNEQDLDQVHDLCMKYQEEINTKTLDIINLKERLQEMQDELEDMKNLQEQNELQQRQIDDLHFSLNACRLELQTLKSSEEHKDKQLDELHLVMDQLIKDKAAVYRTTVEQQNDLWRIKQTLKSTQEQYEKVQELYKKTQFELELLQVEQGKLNFQNDKDRQEIEHLRHKLKQYLEQTTELTKEIQHLEKILAITLEENTNLKRNFEQMNDENRHVLLQENTKDAEVNHLPSEVPWHRKSSFQSTNTPVDHDFLELQRKCEKLQANIDSIKNNTVHSDDDKVLQTLNDFINNKIHSSNDCPENDIDILNLSVQGNKLLENLDKLNLFLRGKQHLLNDTNENMLKLVTENEILKRKLCEMDTDTLTLQLQQNINDSTQEYIQMKGNLENHIAKVARLQEKLLKNDAKLYKLERKLSSVECPDEKFKVLQLENNTLKQNLSQEQASKTDLNEKLVQATARLKRLEGSLQELQIKPRPTKSQATQCLLTENLVPENSEITILKEQVSQLQQQQRHIHIEKESKKREERLQFLHQMMDLQNNKIENIQNHQNDWEDMLASLKNAQHLEEKSRKELALKRMELEELNQVFAKQNEEFRKLEEFTSLLEIKRQQEKEEMKLTFQQEISVMKHHLQDYRNEIEQQKFTNQQLEKQSSRFQKNSSEDFATEVAEYRKEIRELKSIISRITGEKQDLLQHLKELENQTKDFENNKREAILMPDFNLVKVMDFSTQASVENVEALQQNINENHLRILTKVLEGEYQRKMQRYDNHIHSLLSNLKSLKRSLKSNEEKTALLSEEQLKTKEELKGLQSTKRDLAEMRLKYEQSENTVQELKKTLAFQRKKFDPCDLGRSSPSIGTSYEVSNLIDDYKKLIQQSAIATKRPPTSAILDLIQRSNQCVPNLHNLETNVEGLRYELQNFLTSCSQKIPATLLIPTASLSVPASLMDELRAASEGI